MCLYKNVLADIISQVGLSKYRKYLSGTNLLLILGGGVGAYLAYQYFTRGPNSEKDGLKKNKQLKNKARTSGAQGVDNPRLELVVSPLRVAPFVPTPVHIKGVFKGDDNQPSPVVEGFFTIYDNNNNIITQGTLGKNISTFDKTVQLPPLPNSIISVQVSDAPIEDNQGATITT